MRKPTPTPRNQSKSRPAKVRTDVRAGKVWSDDWLSPV
jgi:hypothetical protein